MGKTMQVRSGGTALILSPTIRYGLMRSLPFDGTFVIGVAALALFSGWLAVIRPTLFPLILTVDLWLLGYHHVVATFTRLAFDADSFKEHRFLVVWLPMIVVLATIFAALIIGPWILATAYLYWQWFHYTRQSYGIARIYQRKSEQGLKLNTIWESGIIYFLPLTGIMFRSYQNPGRFLGLDLKCLPVPFFVVQIMLLITMFILMVWVAQQLFLFREGRLPIGYTAYMISHILIFLYGYLLIEKINEGWLVLNVWHNAQYVIFVWMYNNNRFKSGIDANHRFISTLSQSKNIFLYYTTCLVFSTALYMAAPKLLGLVTSPFLPWALIVYQTINFHHYIVDGVIWRIRKKRIRETIGIEN